MFIYLLENKINGKQYVGKTSKSIEQRLKRHLYDSNHSKTKLYNAFKKYGFENFNIYIIEQTGVVSNSRLNDREIYWISVLEPEYNMTKGGDGGLIYSQKGKKWKIKDTSKMKFSKKITDKVLYGRKKISGKNNYQSTNYIYTPWGTFETWRDAIETAKKEKLNGNDCVLTDRHSLFRYCSNNILLNCEGRRTPKPWRGRYTKDLGFYMIKKDNT